MTKCAFKYCKNNSSIQLKKDGVSYHRFPQSFIIRERWRKVVAKDRNDRFYKPNESSVICSKHFLESDMYDTKKGFRRLKRCAVPHIQETDSETDDSQKPQIVNMEFNDISIPTPIQSNKKGQHTCREAESSGHSKCPFIMHYDLPRQPQDVHKVIEPSLPGNFSRMSSMSCQLKRCHKKINAKNRQIQNLIKLNKRLMRNNVSLQEIVKNLNKKRLTDESLCSNIKNTDESVQNVNC